MNENSIYFTAPIFLSGQAYVRKKKYTDVIVSCKIITNFIDLNRRADHPDITERHAVKFDGTLGLN